MMDELYCKFVGALWGMLLCLMISMLAGCGAKKPAVLTRTDSVRVTKAAKDTVYWDRIMLRYVERTNTDKTVNRDSTATTVDEEGNVKKTETWHWRDRYVEKLAEHANEGQLRDVQGESGLADEHWQKKQ